MTRALRAACVIVGLAWAQSAVADPSLKDLAARTEVRAIETLTLTDQQFLTGDKNGKAVTIAGELRFPQGASGRLPAVILQHGSGGPNGRRRALGKNFQRNGDRVIPRRQFLGARADQHVHQPGAARPSQHDSRWLSRLRCARQPSRASTRPGSR